MSSRHSQPPSSRMNLGGRSNGQSTASSGSGRSLPTSVGSRHLSSVSNSNNTRNGSTNNDPPGPGHLNVTVRDRDRIFTGAANTISSPGFRNSSSIPLELNMVGRQNYNSPEERNRSDRTVFSSPPTQPRYEFKPPRSPLKTPSSQIYNISDAPIGGICTTGGYLLPNQIMSTMTSTPNRNSPTNGQNSNSTTTNYAFRKSVTMGSISKFQEIDKNSLDNASITNNNISFGGINNNCDSVTMLGKSGVGFTDNDSKNCSTTSSVAAFAFGGANSTQTQHTMGHNSQSNVGSRISKEIVSVYKSITKREIQERDLEDALTFLRTQPDGVALKNSTSIIEKLKLHLIHQQKHEDAKRFFDLCNKLKHTRLLKNQQAVYAFMYELFDKEATRMAFNARGGRRRLKAEVSYPASNDEDPQRSRKLGSSNEGKEGEWRQQTGQPMDPTEMPVLNYMSDILVQNEIHRSQSHVPSLKVVPRNNGVDQRSINRGGNNMENVLYPSTAKIITFPKDHRDLLLSSSSNSMKPPSTVKITESSVSSFDLGSRGSHPFGNMKTMENELVKDLIFVFQGIDGKIVRYNSTGKYELHTNKPVHSSYRMQTLRLCELGFFYKQIRHYCDKPLLGLMAQGFKHALEKELQEYYRLLAVVQSQIQESIVDTPMSDHSSNSGEDMTLLKLSVWMLDTRPRMELLAGMIQSSDGRIGGELCSILYKYSLHGDPMICSVTNSMLSTVAKPMYLMLCQWILYGELEDPYGEFFIAADISCKKEQLWHAKYHIRHDMRPSFISVAQAERILATGKNINFLKEICLHTTGYEGRQQIKSWLERSPVDCLFMDDDKVLNSAIEKAYKTTSEMVLNVLIQESKLIDHLKAIKNYLLLGQGDFIQHLLELIQDELHKPATKLYNHNLSAILESAIRATNSQYENEDILSRLDTRILPCSDKDLGWDVFCLDYKVHGPIGTVLTEDVMIRYNRMFNALWRTKRIEMTLSTLWKDQTALFKCQRFIPELGPVLHRSQLLISEMIHFVHQTQYYIMFEATECAWDYLMQEVSKASDLDEVIKAHSKFLTTITSRSLLDSDNRELLNQLRGIFDTVQELKLFLVEFESRVATELQHRKSLTTNSVEEQEQAQKVFFAGYIKQAKGKIETLYTTTQDLVRSFLFILNEQADLNLHCLSFRLDFNNYYQLKYSRLGDPFTIQHRRLSLNTLDPMNASQSMSHSSMFNDSMFTAMSISESIAED